MKTSDHEQLHDWVIRAALAGSAISVLGLIIGNAPFGVASALFVALIGVAIVPPRSIVDGALLMLPSIAAAAAMRLPQRASFSIVAVLVGFVIAQKLPAVRDRLVAFALGASATMGALVIRRAFVETELLVPFIGVGLSTMFAGTLAGAVIGLGSIGRLVGHASAKVPVSPAADLDRLATEIEAASSDVSSLLRRAAEAHRQAEQVVGPLAAQTDLVRRMVGFGQEWLEIERRAAVTKPETLTERIALLENRLEKTTDPVAKAELERAIAAVEAQKQALSEILAGRERAVARLEHQVATLERLRFAALRHRSADAGRLQAELQPVLDELAEAGGDHDLASEALEDADSSVAVLLAPTGRAN